MCFSGANVDDGRGWGEEAGRSQASAITTEQSHLNAVVQRLMAAGAAEATAGGHGARFASAMRPQSCLGCQQVRSRF